MHSNIYLDESGDLGWKLNAPYRAGGSSRYLTIGYLVTPITHCDIPKRIVRHFYDHFRFNPRNEIKASDLKSHHKDYICREAVKMITKRPDFHLGAITVRKENVAAHIRNDGNKLYNYMIGLSAIDIIEDHLSCRVTRDNRSIKVVNGNNLIDYLQTLLWFHKNRPTSLTDCPKHSHNDDGIIFIDWITNIVWSKYEDDYPYWCQQLGNCLNEKRLFF
jgi:hypothetical protein